jgi:hypothetical protein
MPEEKIGDYDRFGEMSKDAITTIVKLHGYNYETVEDIVFMKKAKGNK